MPCETCAHRIKANNSKVLGCRILSNMYSGPAWEKSNLTPNEFMQSKLRNMGYVGGLYEGYVGTKMLVMSYCVDKKSHCLKFEKMLEGNFDD